MKPSVFQGLIRRALDSGALTDKQIADQFHVLPLDVQKWASGASLPHPELQPKIRDWVLKRIS